MSTKPWYQEHPDNIPLTIAGEIIDDPDSEKLFPNQFSALLKSIKGRIEEIKLKSKNQNPLAWFQPSYEQTLKLNAWIYGIDYIVDFDANRIGKTAGGVVNALCWILPNDPTWIMFQPYTDHKGRTFNTVIRPPISALSQIRENLQAKELRGDPRLPFDHIASGNLACYKATMELLANPPFPFVDNQANRTVWVGGPDNDFNKDIVMPEWRKWLPKHNELKFSEYEHSLTITHDNEGNTVHPTSTTSVLFKSYDSKDSKWSGAAVDGIMLTEGVPVDVFNEVRQRYKYPAFASWDYTPYEPRNTAGKSALAHKVFKGEEQLPLHPYVYSGFGLVDAPEHILPSDKKADLIKMWEGKPQGDARIKGIFYSSSPVVLKNYDENFHCLPISFKELQKLYAPRPLILFRGIDPGWGHVTACAWMALAPDGTRYIYRIYAESQRSIPERCEDIIVASGNQRLAHPKSNDTFVEFSPSVGSERIQISWIDYHTFKTDENTKRPFAQNYIKNGVVVRPSITFGPKERATMFNDLLLPQLNWAHPLSKKPPGCKIYFLVNEPGVAAALQKMSNLFWMTFDKGEKRGLSKDAIQDYNDDELDAVCYVSLPLLTYSSFNINQNLSGIVKPDRVSYSNITFTR